MKIRTKFTLGFFLIAVLVGIAGMIGIRTSKQIHEAFYSLINFNVPALTSLYEIKRIAVEIEAQTINFELVANELTQVEDTLGGVKKYELLANVEKIDREVERYEELILRNRETKSIYAQSIVRAKERVVIEALQLIRFYETGEPVNKTFNQKQKLKQERDQLKGVINEAINSELNKLNQEKIFTETILNKMIFISFSVVIFSVLSTIVIGFIVSHVIAGPIGDLRNTVMLVAKGEFGKKVRVSSKDEIGDLAESFNKMSETIKREIQERREQEEKFRGFVETAPDGIVIVNEDGVIELINKQAENIFGYSRTEIIGQPVEALMPKAFHHAHVEYRQEYVKDAKFRRMAERNRDLVAKHKNGSEIPVEISLSPLKLGPKTLVTAAVRDITDRKRAEQVILQKSEELARSNKELEEFAYIASHDLQEPLRKVKAFGDRLIQKYSDAIGEQGKDYLKRMGNAANRMQTLINDLLTYSRVTSQAKPFMPVNLNTIVHDVLSDLEIKIEESKAQVNVGDLPTLEADPVQMRQLFQNLIGNALKFCNPEAPPVVSIQSILKASEEKDVEIGECVRVIKITDNGIGFEEKYKERIFSVFQRLHGRSEYEGTGIGLAVCRKLVTRHGGSIDVESTPGKGTTFIITLPVIQPKENKEGEANAFES